MTVGGFLPPISFCNFWVRRRKKMGYLVSRFVLGDEGLSLKIDGNDPPPGKKQELRKEKILYTWILDWECEIHERLRVFRGWKGFWSVGFGAIILVLANLLPGTLPRTTLAADTWHTSLRKLRIKNFMRRGYILIWGLNFKEEGFSHTCFELITSVLIDYYCYYRVTMRINFTIKNKYK